MTSPIRVAILSHSPLFEQALKVRFDAETGFQMLATCHCLAEMAAAWDRQSLGILLVDADGESQEMRGIVASLRRIFPSTQIIALGVDDNSATQLAWFEAGVTLCLGQDTSFEELRQTLWAVVEGRAACSLDVLVYLSQQLVAGDAFGQAETPSHPLTTRERETALWIAEGLNDREIARRMCIKPSSAKSHVHQLLSKLGLQRRHALLRGLREEGTEDEGVAGSDAHPWN